MLQRTLFFGILFQLGLSLLSGVAMGAEKKFKITVKIQVSGSETRETYIIVPQKNYQLSLNKADTGRSKIALYDRHGVKREGLYWINNKDLARIMKKPVGDIIKLVENRPARPARQCANCATDDAQDHREPAAEPKAAKIPLPKPRPTLEQTPIPKPRPEFDTVSEPVVDAEPPSGDLCAKFALFKRKGVPEAPLRQALAFFSQHPEKFSNKQFISIADYSQRSNKKRFYMLDLKNGSVINEKVSHGSGKLRGTRKAMSDPNNDGMVDRCEHPSRALAAAKNSKRHYKTRENMTRPGFFSTGSLNLSASHRRKWPRITKNTNSLILNGLSGRINGSARGDGVLMHEAYYNFNGVQNMGKSWGCPAFVPGHGAPIIKKIMGGSLYYSYVPVCKSDMAYVLKDAQGWESFCSK